MVRRRVREDFPAGGIAVDNDRKTMEEIDRSKNVMKQINELLNEVPLLRQLFSVQGKIGEGSYSQVYLAKLRHHPYFTFALKYTARTTRPSRMEIELRCLKEIGGVDYVMGIHCCIRERDHLVMVMPFFDNTKLEYCLYSMTLSDVRGYMFALLTALKRVHQHNIVHRDVKPGNFLYNPKIKSYMLIDFGLAHKVTRRVQSLPVLSDSTSYVSSDRPKPSACQAMESPVVLGLYEFPPDQDEIRSTQSSGEGQEGQMCRCDVRTVCKTCIKRKAQSANRAGTAGYRPPEVLMNSKVQTCAVDMWAAGAILLSLLSKRYPFFKPTDDMSSLAQIITILGSDAVQKGAMAFGKHLHSEPSQSPQLLSSLCLSLRRGEHINPVYAHLCSQSESFQVPDSAYELLGGLLDPNPFTRLTAEKALNHAFFKYP